MASQVVEITDRESGSAARVIVSLGFNCFSWRPMLAEGGREMLWAEDDFEAGDKRPSGSGTPLLFPFPGRIGGTAFTFEGRTYQLEPGDPFGNAIHGFVFSRPWRIVEENESRLVGEFQASVDDPSILERWPSDFRIRVGYEVQGRALVSDVFYENSGERAMPCGFGTHAYFRLPLVDGSEVDETKLTVPVERFWEVEQMIPTGRRLPVPVDQSLQCGLRLDNHQFDTCFTGVRADSDGRVRTCVADPATGRTLMQTFDQAFTQCVVYTPGHRQAVCIEPYTCVPDAIRLRDEGNETGLQILQPGESFNTTLRLEVT